MVKEIEAGCAGVALTCNPSGTPRLLGLNRAATLSKMGVAPAILPASEITLTLKTFSIAA
jgi:hypothetical protein